MRGDKDRSRGLTSNLVKGRSGYEKAKYEIPNNSCKICGIKNNLEIHHEIYPKNIKEIKKEIDNERIYYLCNSCHIKVSKSERVYHIKNIEEKNCECGWEVKGSSKIHAEANLKIHKQSKLHKKLMKIRKEKEE